MHDLTHGNHFKFGYDNQWFRFRDTAQDQWMVSYGAIQRQPKPFNEECEATAALIRDTVAGPITVLFSGGVDSEVVIRAFHAQKIPIRVAILQFDDNLNIHDVSFAVVCCEQLGLPYKLIPLDIKKFLDDEVYNYAAPTNTRSPELCSTMWLADQVDGVPVIGSGECFLVKRVEPSYVDGVSSYLRTPWDMYERELIAAWYRHFMIPGKERMAVPGFFQYTPEIMLSFLKDECVIDLVNDRMIGKRSTMTSKFGIYQKYFPLAERKKYSGFEKIYSRVSDLRVDFRRRWPDHAGQFLTEYNDLVAMLEGNIEGPKGVSQSNVASQVEVNVKPDDFIDETRLLNDNDYEQVMEMIEERFSTVVEYDKARKKNFIKLDESTLGDFRRNSLVRWRGIIADYYLKGVTHKIFGSFHKGQLMSMVGMRLVFENAWVLSNLKAKDVPLSQTGLKQTMTALYQHVKELGLKEYYCCVANYRYRKFQIMMRRLVPEYYNEYEDEVVSVVPAGEQPTVDFWWGMMGRRRAPVDVAIKKMRLKT
jgi:hypothetical protein